MDRGAWKATVHGETKESDTTELLSTYKYIDIHGYPNRMYEHID